jgi:hypothetical protein
VTKAEWLECDDPEKMLAHLQRKKLKPSDRKLRLFACACIRRVWNQLTDPRSLRAVEVAERYADLQAKAKDLDSAYYAACDASDEATAAIEQMDATQATLEVYDRASVVDAAAFAAARDIVDGVIVLVRTLSHTLLNKPTNLPANTVSELKVQARLLRCIFGNPFRPVNFAASCRTPPMKAFAQGIYDERAFDRLPVLADALEEAGCTNPDILTHCRQRGEHARGCWAVDLLLGKK